MRIDSVENDSSYEWRRDGWLAACSLTAILLVISALTPHAAGFDTFLRLFVFCLALVRGFAGFRKGGAWLPLSAAAIAILFNPARPLAMTSIAWTWCDLIAAAWFAIVGAWRLLGSWHPQRGWAAAAISLGALAVPAVGALNAPNRDALTAPNLNENLAVMNAGGNEGITAPEMNTTVPAPAHASAGAATPIAHGAANTPVSEPANGVTREDRQVSAETNVVREPPIANNDAASSEEPLNETPTTDEPANGEDDGVAINPSNGRRSDPANHWAPD